MLEQANALLPWSREQLAEIDMLTHRHEEVQGWLNTLHQRVRSNGHRSQAEEAGALRTEMQILEGKLAALIQGIGDRGIILREMRTGLVDFLSKRDGEDMYLCWIKGEDAIRFWHPLNAGFTGRQPP